MRISDWSSDVCSSDLLMGDLNEWSAMAGCLRDFGRDYHFAETGPSFHARRPIARLDRIMVSSDLIVADAGVHFSPAARKASGPLPIWATLERKSEPGSTLALLKAQGIPVAGQSFSLNPHN